MLRLATLPRLLFLCLLASAVVLLASPGYAQTGALQGVVRDTAGKPIEKAQIVIEYADGINRKYEVKSNKKGEFIQIGLPPGGYKVTASADKLGSQSTSTRVRLGEPTKLDFVLGGPSTGAGPSKEDAAKTVALKKLFEEGVASSKAGNFDEAIAKFTEASLLVPPPGCFDCYYNIGYNYMQKKEYDKAEEAYLKAVEMKPNYAEAYNGLATVYNAQKKFDKALEASSKAAEYASAAGPGGAGGSGGVDAEYNQGVIAWNAGKIPEAAEHFQKVIFMKPDHADAHYQLGMAFVNQNKLAEAVPMFEKYLELAPTGQFAATAKGILSSIKK